MSSTTNKSVTWRAYFLVAMGGALGGAGRYSLSLALVAVGSGAGLPWATLLANIIGSFLIGLYSALPTSHRWANDDAHLFISAGFCGGFTTFSLFSLEILTLLQQQQWLLASIWLALSVSLWLVAVTLGYLIGKRFSAA